MKRTAIPVFLLALALPALAADPATNAPAATPAAAFATNAPAATLEQLLAEPWRKRLSPDADPVAEMRKIGTLDAFADTRVLFLGAGVCLHHLHNDPEDIAPERDRCNLVRELFRETRPAAGIHFARGGSSRTLVFDVLPREGDPEWPDPVRAVPFEFDAFAPADFPEDLVVRLPGEDRWVRVPGLGEVAMPWRAAAHFLDAIVASFAVDEDANAIDVELADFKFTGIRFEETDIGNVPGAPRGEKVETLRSSFRLKAGRCVEFAEHHASFLFSAYPRDGLPDDIRAALGPPETAPGPFLVVTRIGGFRRNYPMRYVLVPEDSPAAPNALRFSLGRFLLWPLDEDPEPHAAPAEEEPHAESAENAEPDPHAEPAWGDAMYFLDLLEWQKRNPDAFAAALAALAKDFATNALVALPALAADEGLGNTVEPIVGARCRLFEVAADAYREEASDGIFPLKAAYGNRTPGILPEEVLKRCFDGTLERLPGIKLLWEDSFAATRGEAARFSVGPLPSATGRPLRLDLAASASFDDRANAAFFDVDFSLRPDGAGDDAPAVVLGSGKSQRVWWGGGYAVVARPVPRAEDSVPPYYLAVIGNWEHDGYRSVPVRPVGREVLDARYAEAAERGRDVLADVASAALAARFGHPATNAPAATPAAAFDTTLFAAFATNVPCWPPPESPSFDEVLHALPDFASFRTGRGFCPFGDGSGGSYSERFLAYRSPDSAEDALFALFPGTYRAPGLAALLDRAHPPSGAAEETHAESAESESHAENAETAEP